MPEKARALLDDLITLSGETYLSISQLLKKNPAYIQQYVKRGVPVALSAADQQKLASFFGQPNDFLLTVDDPAKTEAAFIASFIDRAIAGCDRAGFELVACHLQMARDLLVEQDAPLVSASVSG